MVLAAASLGVAGSARAYDVPIYGGLTYDAATGNGYRNATIEANVSFVPVNDNGVAVGYASNYLGAMFQGNRAVSWDSSGSAFELDNLGSDFLGATESRAYSINSAGQVVGYARKHVAGMPKGDRAVRWDSTGSLLELGNLGSETAGFSQSAALSINASGQMAGAANKYVGGIFKGFRAVSWDSTGNVLELDNLGTDASGAAEGRAFSINTAGQTAGFAYKYVSGMFKGSRAVSWASAGSVIELGNLGVDASGVADGRATSINAAGQIAGHAEKYVGGVNKGYRAVRWDSGGNALELGNLGTDALGGTESFANSINAAGQIAGSAWKVVSGMYQGQRAVRWDSNGNALELGNLGTDASGIASSIAYSINTSGRTVGYAEKYVGGTSQGPRATYWNPDGSVVCHRALKIGHVGARQNRPF